MRVKPESWHQAADEDQFFDAENFDRWSDRGLPYLQIPAEAPVDVGRALAYLREGDALICVVLERQRPLN